MIDLEIHYVAIMTLAGNYGMGDDRKRRLSQAGYDYKKVQDEVNRHLTEGTKREITELAFAGGKGFVL